MIGQLEVLGPLVTDRVRELVRDRLLHGLKFFDGHTLRPQFKESRCEARPAIGSNRKSQRTVIEGRGRSD